MLRDLEQKIQIWNTRNGLKRAKKSYKATGGAKKVRKSKQKGGQLNIDGNLLAQLQTYEITMNTLNNIKTAFENNINIER